jgi:glycosyltransferase involved in cell wall biosynthesis
MTIKVLAIGDIGNILQTLQKYTKADIHVINFFKDGAGQYTYEKNIETFSNYKVTDHIKKINQISQDYDVCITMGTGERIAYLADLNYSVFYVGRDIDTPRFIKNSREEWFNEPLHTLNFIERWFYKKCFQNANFHLAYTWVFEHLKKYTKNGIKLDMMPIDSNIFKTNVKPLQKQKSKFTFFSPQRMGKPKGTDLIWKALTLCKSDFEVIQVEWFDVSTKEELEIKDDLIKNKPKQVKFIPMIKREDMSKYYNFADAILGNMRIGTYALIELEGIFCKKPVIQYTNKNMKIFAGDKELDSPMVPTSNKPNEIAKIIDKIVEDDDFRKKLLEQEYEFAKEISDPKKVAEWWDNFFLEIHEKYPKIKKKSSKFVIKARLFIFLLGNRLYLKKIKRRLGIN